MNKSSIAEHLVNNPKCGNNLEISKITVFKQCLNTFKLIRFKAILICLNKPKLCKNKESHYITALIS